MDEPLNQTEQDSLIASEQSTLGGILINPSCLEDVFEIVSPGDFMTASHRLIAGAMEYLGTQSQPVDVVTLAEHLTGTDQLEAAGGAAYLVEIYEGTPSAANVRAYARSVADHSHRRQLMAALDESAKSVYTAPIRPLSEIISGVQSSIAELEKSRDVGAGPQGLDSAAKEVLLDWNTLERGEQVPRVHTGWSNVDKRLKGLRGGELMIVAGTTGTGKTVFAMQAATHNALDNKRALVFSLEMSRRELYRRMVGQVGRIPVWLADSDSQEDRARFYEQHSTALSVAVGKLKGVAMEVDDQGALHINQIAGRARRAHRKNPLSLIVVDYLQLVRGDGQSREREVASVSAGLKALAKELYVPVIALSQFNREAGKGGRPSMAQLRDSGSLEQDADIVTLLYRPEKDSEDPINPGLTEVIISKHRRGEPGIEFLNAKLAHFRMDVWAGEIVPHEQPKKFNQFKG